MTFYFVTLGDYDTPYIKAFRVQAENERQAYWLALVQYNNEAIDGLKLDPYNPPEKDGWVDIRDELMNPEIEPDTVLNDQELTFGITPVCSVQSLYYNPPEK